jgi:hypothetical protein
MKEMPHVSVAPVRIQTQTDAASPWSGIRALMLAVLEEAIQNFGSPVGHVSADAERWIMSREHRYVFSFAVICETLNLEPSAVRRSVIRLLDSKRPGRRRLLQRVRPYVHPDGTIQLRSARRRSAWSRPRQTQSPGGWHGEL